MALVCRSQTELQNAVMTGGRRRRNMGWGEQMAVVSNLYKVIRR